MPITSQQVDYYSDMPNGEVHGPEITHSPEQARRASRAQVAALEVRLAEMRDLWMRAEAETANVRQRAKRDVEETRNFAVQKFAAEIVEAAENLRRGLDSMPAASGPETGLLTRLREGFASVERSVVAVLERNGILRQDPTGSIFDPTRHQAMAEQETAAHPPGTVLKALTSVWTLNGRPLRPAMVVIAKPPTSVASPAIAAGRADPAMLGRFR